MRPEEFDAWMRLAAIGFAAAFLHILRVVSRGTKITKNTVAAHVSRAILTGFLAAGIHSVITNFWVVSPTFGVAVAAATAMLGVDALEKAVQDALPQLLEKFLGVKLNKKEEKEDGDA